MGKDQVCPGCEQVLYPSAFVYEGAGAYSVGICSGCASALRRVSIARKPLLDMVRAVVRQRYPRA